MGRLIHTNDLHNAVMMNKRDWGIFDVTIDNLIEGVVSQVPTVEAIPKADYETRLKADLKAILVELQLEIEELRLDRPLMSRGHECYGFEDKTPTEIQQECSEIIQQKIDELEAESEDNNV